MINKNKMATTILALAISCPVLADVNKVYGFQDYRGVLSPNSDGTAKTITIKTSCCDVGIGPLSMHVDVFTDSITIEVKSATNMAAKGFVKPIIGTIRSEVTVVYGLDLNPSGALGPMTGFDPADPQVSIAKNEIIIGRSGRKYQADTRLESVESVKNKFPNHDLDMNFHGASPSSLVIVATAIIPNHELGPFYAHP